MSRRAALSVAAANLLARLTGLAREVVMAGVFGAGMVTDAFNAAFRVPQLLRELLAEGSLQNAVVPAVARVTEEEGRDEAWKLANALLGLLLLVLGAATLVFWVGAEGWVRVVANGFSTNPEKLALTTTLTRWLSPFLAGLSLAALFSAMLNVRGRFFLPAMAQNVINLVVIAACFAAPAFERVTGQPAIVAVALATTLSGFLHVGLVWPQLHAEGFRLRPTLGRHPQVRRTLAFLGPALIGVSTVQANLLVESQWASTWGDGPVTWLYLSFRLVQVPLAIVAGSVATGMLPALSLLAARREMEAFGRTLADALRLNALLVVPCAAALWVLAEPAIRLVYEHGAFDATATAGTAAMLRMYALACYAICFHRVAVPVYYALGRPKLPMWLAIGTVVLKVPIVLGLTRGLGMGPEALPLSHAITVSGEMAVLAWGLRTHLAGSGLALDHGKMLVAAALLAVLATALLPHVGVVVAGGVAGAAYLALTRLAGLNLRPPRRP
jgi:putative peptidoglycan lipid II flippase